MSTVHPRGCGERRLTLPVREPEDIAALADALAKLVPLGNLGIQASVVRDRLGFPDPEDGADLLGQPAAPALQRAANRRSAAVAHPADLQAETLADQADAEIAKMLDRIRVMLEQADDLEQFREMLLAAYGDLYSGGLVEAIGQAMAASHLAGRYDVSPPTQPSPRRGEGQAKEQPSPRRGEG